MVVEKDPLGDESDDLEEKMDEIEKNSEKWEECWEYFGWGNAYDEAKQWCCPKCGEKVIVFVPFNCHPDAGHDNIHFIKPETILKINSLKQRHNPDLDTWIPEVELMKKELDFIRLQKYLSEIKSGSREPNGKDEYGDVPYICEKCKRNEATIYSRKGHFCKDCDKEE